MRSLIAITALTIGCMFFPLSSHKVTSPWSAWLLLDPSLRASPIEGVGVSQDNLCQACCRQLEVELLKASVFIYLSIFLTVQSIIYSYQQELLPYGTFGVLKEGQPSE
jgi:hypothetical protein